LTDYLLGILSLYGVPVLFAVLLVGGIGIPMPSSLMLIAAGSFIEQGDLSYRWVLVLGSLGAIIGDNIGYLVGRWGGPKVSKRISRWVGGEKKLLRAEEWARRWGGTGVFMSRWLLTPLGSWINLTSGASGYSWYRFLVFDIVGEVLWVLLYVSLGQFFNDRVQEMNELLGDVVWLLVGLIVAMLLGWKLLRYLRPVKLPVTDPESGFVGATSSE
jgi:membrane-associated protein